MFIVTRSLACCFLFGTFYYWGEKYSCLLSCLLTNSSSFKLNLSRDTWYCCHVLQNIWKWAGDMRKHVALKIWLTQACPSAKSHSVLQYFVTVIIYRWLLKKTKYHLPSILGFYQTYSDNADKCCCISASAIYSTFIATDKRLKSLRRTHRSSLQKKKKKVYLMSVQPLDVTVPVISIDSATFC